MQVNKKIGFDNLGTAAALAATLTWATGPVFVRYTYERVDKARGEFFHTNWTGRGGSTAASTYVV